MNLEEQHALHDKVLAAYIQAAIDYGKSKSKVHAPEPKFKADDEVVLIGYEQAQPMKVWSVWWPVDGQIDDNEWHYNVSDDDGFHMFRESILTEAK